MCGRFVRGGDSTDYAEVMELDSLPDVPRSYNVAPSQAVLAALVHEGRREGMLLRWGLVPFWSRDGKRQGRDGRHEAGLSLPPLSHLR